MQAGRQTSMSLKRTNSNSFTNPEKINIMPISLLSGSEDPNRRLPQLWCGAKVASPLAMIMNFPSHSKAKLLLLDRESTKGGKKQERASSSAAVAVERPCSPNVNAKAAGQNRGLCR